MCRSVPQIPAHRTRIFTSLMPGSGSGTSSSHRPRAARLFTRAFISISFGTTIELEQSRRRFPTQRSSSSHFFDWMREGSSEMSGKEKTGAGFKTQALPEPVARTLTEPVLCDTTGCREDSVTSLEHNLQRQLDLA